ncbi:MAG: phosphoribosyltransferase [Blastocatellia bacterium]|nr:phosphoribosyltransferase [Blastocatellia bacterium]
MEKKFRNRAEAGRKLAKRLLGFANRKDVVVLALPRGGVPVAFEIATALSAPLDVLVVRKLGFPGFEELALGAIAMGGVQVLNEELLRYLFLPKSTLTAVVAAETKELGRREAAYRKDLGSLTVKGKIVIVVDDGIATGSTMQAALAALKSQEPAKVVVAVPVAAPEADLSIRQLTDQFVCLATPTDFEAVGKWYHNFPQTSDEEVTRLLAATRSVAAA